jgi:hypothetical protein
MEIIAAGYEFAHNDDYDRTLPDLKEGTLLFDDASSYELEAFVKALKPDLIGSGIKENISSRKWGCRSARCTLGLFRPVSRLRWLRHFRPRYGYDPEQPGVERTDRPVAEVCVIAHSLSRLFTDLWRGRRTP